MKLMQPDADKAARSKKREPDKAARSVNARAGLIRIDHLFDSAINQSCTALILVVLLLRNR